MPIEIIDRYKIRCESRGYVWVTKYTQISAKCPSCATRIYGTENYTILTRYIHHERTEEEKKRTRRTIGMIFLGLFVFISLVANWWVGFFLFSGILAVWLYSFYKKPRKIESKVKNNLKSEISITIPKNKKDLETTLICPKCGGSINYKHTVGKEGSLYISCKLCKSRIYLESELIKSWRCEYCKKKYNTKLEAEKHEKVCDKTNK